MSLLERDVRSEWRGICAKTENRTFARGVGEGRGEVGCLKSEQVRTRGEGRGECKKPPNLCDPSDLSPNS